MKYASLLLCSLTFLIGCTLVPCPEYSESDTLDSNVTIESLNGTYRITKGALAALGTNYDSAQRDSMKHSKISINSSDTTIMFRYIPIEVDRYKYEFNSGSGRFWISDLQNDKFRKIDISGHQATRLYYREKNGKPSILVFLGGDPDNCNYREYVKVN